MRCVDATSPWSTPLVLLASFVLLLTLATGAQAQSCLSGCPNPADPSAVCYTDCTENALRSAIEAVKKSCGGRSTIKFTGPNCVAPSYVISMKQEPVTCPPSGVCVGGPRNGLSCLNPPDSPTNPNQPNVFLCRFCHLRQSQYG